ncbi:MAG: hypothetical protein A2Y94_05115 [Caldithrix sp. RBG_13_44_9]|nr:MAG: hypothetical protein A2Y94_05115 [Caldithrix sp. RBG_13_44_9]
MLNRIKNNIKSNLIPGIIILVPLVITIMVLKWLIGFFDALIKPVIENYIDIYIPGLGLLVSLIFIYLIGLSTKYYFGNKLIQIGEWLVVRIPVAKTVYIAVKQIMTTLASRDKKMTQKVVMVEYPSKGMYSLGLYNGQLSHPVSGQVVGSILIITSINPASGFTVLIPLNNILFVDMTVEQMMKFVVSGGIVMPEKIRLISAEEQVKISDRE